MLLHQTKKYYSILLNIKKINLNYYWLIDPYSGIYSQVNYLLSKLVYFISILSFVLLRVLFLVFSRRYEEVSMSKAIVCSMGEQC